MIWVLAYGNPLRQDDALGPWVAEQLAAHARPGMEVRVGHQLQPEWLEDLRDGDVILFVDAALSGPEVNLEELNLEADVPPAATHQLSPAQFCRLARDLYGLELRAHLCTMRGEAFELGAPLTAPAAARAQQALARIEEFLARPAS